jgi:hypothetical protein
VAIARATNLRLGDVRLRELRVPADAALDLRLVRGSFQTVLNVGLVAALANYEYERTGIAHSALKLGGRVGLRLGWGRRIMPWLGTSLEVLPSATELRFSPVGSLGRAPGVWLGLALGTEVRWP